MLRPDTPFLSFSINSTDYNTKNRIKKEPKFFIIDEYFGSLS